MTITRYRNTLAGTGTVSQTSINTAGPSSILSQSFTTSGTASFVAPPGTSRQSSVVHVQVTASGKSDVRWAASQGQTQFTSSVRIRWESTAPSKVWQVLNVQSVTGTAAQRSLAAVNRQASGALQVWGYKDDGTGVYRNGTAVLAADKWWRIDLWGDIVAQTLGYALYDESDALVETNSYTGINLGATDGTCLALACFAGKVDTGDGTGITFDLSEHATDLGSADSLGVPSMVIPTPPTVSKFPHMTVRPGDAWQQLYLRTTPTTDGATEVGMTATVGTPTDADGNAVDASLIVDAAGKPSTLTFGAPTTTTEVNRTVQLTNAPFCRKLTRWPVTMTGTDSLGMSATWSIVVTLLPHDWWTPAGVPMLWQP